MKVTPTVLVAGPHGITGRAITRRLAGHDEFAGRECTWNVVTTSRRSGPVVPGTRHVSADLLNPGALAGADALRDVTHLVYAAYLERPTMAESTAPNLAMLTNLLDGLRASKAPLQRVVLIGGGKSYGEHLGPYKTPAKESDPRFLGPIFYNDQEDLLAEQAGRDGFGFTVLRPDVVVGFSLGSPMNLVNAIGVYAALCRAEGVPLRFPGTPAAWTALHQVTDAGLLASAVEWALTSDAARGEVLNVTNGDQFRWQHLWEDIADVFEMPVAAPQPMKLADQMGGKEAAWDALVSAHRLRPTPYQQIASWEFADGVLGSGYDLVQSTIKIRRAGFPDCLDSHESFTHQLRWLRDQRYLP